MNIREAFRSRPQQVLDRLVDGELGLEDRRALLAALDDEPGAWRQCALAFLEAQQFGWQLSRAASEPLLAQENSPRKLHVAGHRAGRFTWPLALAASVLVAFTLGGQLADRAVQKPELAGNPVAGKPGAGHAVIVGAGPSADVKPDAYAQRQLTSLTVPASGSDEALELPVDDSADAAANAAQRSLAVSGALAQQFQRDGFEVSRQQQLWPVELPDGRSVLVPVEEFHIQSPEVQRL